MNYNKSELANLILIKLESKKNEILTSYLESQQSIGYFFIDDLLPKKIALEIYNHFPSTQNAILKKSLREFKYVAYQMDQYHPLLQEVIYAFQDHMIVDFFKENLNISSLYPDDNLYAGGLSLMSKNNFLNPHLDNSHDKDRSRWRVFNLLYYVTPDWKLDNGGNLEIWPNGLKSEPITIESKFNRLVVMATHQKSWHSVSKVSVDDVRCCVSNYYFSDNPLRVNDAFHVTSFRGWPKQKIIDPILNLDSKIRMMVRTIFKKGIVKNPHVYKKKKAD
ncbi:MAG: 2OG-Fe(II) oxygenase [Flavobacteriaceae bacterium]